MSTRRLAGQSCVLFIFIFPLVALCMTLAAESDSGKSDQSKPQLNLKTGLEVGNRAPDFVGTDLNGEEIQLQSEAERSKYVLLDFWASWCGPCRAEFPHLRRLHEDFGERGLTIIGVCSDTDRETASRAAASAKLDYSHIYHAGDGQSVTDLYRVTGIPQTYLLDSNGKIVAKGLRGTSLERRIEELFASDQLANLKYNDTIVVTAKSANLKVSHDVLAKLSKGQKLNVLTKQGSWIWTSVEQDGKEIKGWVDARRVALVSSPTETITQPKIVQPPNVPDSEQIVASNDAPNRPEELQPEKSAPKSQTEPDFVPNVEAPVELAETREAQQASSRSNEIQLTSAVIPSVPPPAEPEPAQWELAGRKAMPQLFEFANAASGEFDMDGDGVGEVRRFELTGMDFSAAAVSPDGRFVVSGGYDSLIRIWEAESGQEVGRIEGHRSAVTALAYSDDGMRILAGGIDGSVSLWDVDCGVELYRFAGHDSEVTSVTFVSQGRFATSTAADRTLRMWRLPQDAHEIGQTPAVPNLSTTVVAHKPDIAPATFQSVEEAPAPPEEEQKPAESSTESTRELAQTESETVTETETIAEQPQVIETSPAPEATVNEKAAEDQSEPVDAQSKQSVKLTEIRGEIKLNSAGNLVSLDFRGTDIDDTDLLNLPQLDHLETLYLRGRNISDVGLASLTGMKQLKNLWLTDTKISDEGLKSIKNFAQLESLVLSGCEAVTDRGLAHLSELKSLGDLWLNGTQVTDAGLPHLSELIQLEMLVLPANKTITDAGLVHLKTLTHIRDLWVNGAAISDAGLAHLEPMASLQYIDAGHTKVTAVGVEQLKSALPQIEIEH